MRDRYPSKNTNYRREIDNQLKNRSRFVGLIVGLGVFAVSLALFEKGEDESFRTEEKITQIDVTCPQSSVFMNSQPSYIGDDSFEMNIGCLSGQTILSINNSETMPNQNRDGYIVLESKDEVGKIDIGVKVYGSPQEVLLPNPITYDIDPKITESGKVIFKNGDDVIVKKVVNESNSKSS